MLCLTACLHKYICILTYIHTPILTHTHTHVLYIYLVDGAKAPTSRFHWASTSTKWMPLFCMKNKLQSLLLRERKNFYLFIEYETVLSLSVKRNLVLRKSMFHGKKKPACSVCFLCFFLFSPLSFSLFLVLILFQDTWSHGILSIYFSKVHKFKHKFKS